MIPLDIPSRSGMCGISQAKFIPYILFIWEFGVYPEVEELLVFYLINIKYPVAPIIHLVSVQR